VKVSLRLALTGLAALMSVVFMVQPAIAHAPYAEGVVYSGGTLCTISRAQIAFDHTTKALTASAKTEGRLRSSATSGCDTIDVWAPGWLAVSFTVYKWSLTNARWEKCTTSKNPNNPNDPWVYNTSWTWQLVAETNFGTNYPCWNPSENATAQRPTYYYTVSSSWIWDGTAWRGGSKTSGYHPVPA
jgi:hypothetical protein